MDGQTKVHGMIVPLHSVNFCARKLKLLARRHSNKFTQKVGFKMANCEATIAITCMTSYCYIDTTESS